MEWPSARSVAEPEVAPGSTAERACEKASQCRLGLGEGQRESLTQCNYRGQVKYFVFCGDWR